LPADQAVTIGILISELAFLLEVLLDLKKTFNTTWPDVLEYDCRNADFTKQSGK